jgi:leucyl aminopeptidase
MRISLGSQKPADASVDLLVIAVAGDGDQILTDLDQVTAGHLGAFLKRRGFGRQEGGVALYQSPPGTLKTEYLLVVRRYADPRRTWRFIGDQAVNRARELRSRKLAIAAPADAVSTLAEIIDLTAYHFAGFKAKTRDASPSPAEVILLTSRGKATSESLRRARARASATCLARDLINLPAEVATPAFLATQARRIAKRSGLTVRVLGVPQLRRLRMGALLGVARGSVRPPYLIELVYRPRGRASRRVAIVGKGITFDSGGLSLKSPESMQTQKRDMSGGAVVLGVMSALRELGVKAEVRGYVPATENMPSGSAIKPGDVLEACNGKTIEVLNTDAEGRLVLADALAYALRAKPDAMIDFATLTAAVRTALGPRYAAVMATDPELCQTLIRSAADVGENLWELPLVEDYRRDLDSSVADLKNTGEGHSGTIIGGLFLREFTGKVPWAHIDFSSTAVTDKPFPGHPRGAAGFGVRTVLRYLRADD